ncbi:MAG: methylated-DNA--[protein]-cysteine S-methyltransferase [Balneolales bacterium]
MDLFTEDIMYKAILEKDSAFEGLFYLAVKTTGIFCRPTCTARKPKKENVEFFAKAKEAILHGYRPCKICNPMEKPDKTPEYITRILKDITEHPSRKYKDDDLIEKGIEPHKIRRWFLRHHGLTFHAYQRMIRINSAFKKLKKGESAAAAAYDLGYESLSGFNDSFKSVFGVSPSNSKGKQIIDVTRLDTPLGPMMACANEEGICLLEFTDRKMLETEFKDLSRQLKANIVHGNNEYFELLDRQLGEYFHGDRMEFTIPLFTPGSVFQNQVWDQLKRIPYGETCSYYEQAVAIGKPHAVRAVANANGMNKIAIIIPCHRVIGSDGKLTGYGGGLWRKKYLLDLEKKYQGSRL